eukprot:TRINITY_DN3587_c0_g5_i3.p2 TRINITY_DN3587_c0_g5~~TRINITY_DN3587_c0_g5_i3.p2  ORF type:complete len:181 (-),score=29.44 TRINITY_DN3587_c0_g5_i3:105-647(-)
MNELSFILIGKKPILRLPAIQSAVQNKKMAMAKSSLRILTQRRNINQLSTENMLGNTVKYISLADSMNKENNEQQKENINPINVITKVRPPVPNKEFMRSRYNKENWQLVKIRQRSRRGNVILKPLSNRTFNSTEMNSLHTSKNESFDKIKIKEKYMRLIPVEGWTVDESAYSALLDILN